MAGNESGVKQCASPLWRCGRTFFAVAPLIAFGWWLGFGWQEDSEPRRSPAPMVRLGPQPVLRGSNGDTTGTGAILRGGLRQNQSLELLGGDLAKSHLETTRLPLDEALADYDRQFREKDWARAPEIDKRIAGLDAQSVMRAYRKDGMLRILIIGTKLGQNKPTRPVTVFEGRFRQTDARKGSL